MKKVRITTCCIFYTLNEMFENQLTARMPYHLFLQSKLVNIIAVERLFVIS